MSDLTSTELTIALAAGLVGVGYLVFILIPAWGCYGRLWEKIAASFLTLFVLATLVGGGVAVGFAIVWSYDQYA